MTSTSMPLLSRLVTLLICIGIIAVGGLDGNGGAQLGGAGAKQIAIRLPACLLERIERQPDQRVVVPSILF